jgi:hypothetical protein
MSDEEYAQSKFELWHRCASVGIVIVLAGVYGLQFGVGLTIRSFAGGVLPLAMIWFAESLSGWALEVSGGWLRASNADTALRIAGWLILLFMFPAHERHHRRPWGADIISARKGHSSRGEAATPCR